MMLLARRALLFFIAATVLPGCGAGAAQIVTPTTGSLVLTVQGLPAGTPAVVTISGAQFQQSISQSGTITGLVPGSFTIIAANVSAGATSYFPAPPGQSVSVTAGGTASATVNYSVTPDTTTVTSHFPELSPGFQVRSMVVQGVTYNYKIFVPQGYTPTRSWPVILFGHGSGETGNNNTSQVSVGLGPYVTANAQTFPAVVVFPQLPFIGTGTPEWLDYRMNFMLQAFDETLREVHADSTRLYYTGVSQGAIFGWGMLYKRPTLFAAAALMSGYINGPTMTLDASTSNATGNTLAAQRLGTFPLWVFHGGKDPQVAVALDRAVIAAFQAVGSQIRYTEYAALGHDVWDTAYADPTVWGWLFSQHR